MPRPRRDGTPAQAPNRRKLTDTFLRRVKPKGRAFCAWDTHARGLCVVVQASGHKAFKYVYAFHGRPRWYHIGNAATIALGDARKLAAELAFKVSRGEDIVAAREAERSRGTFEELASRYCEEHAKRRNKSWRQAAALVQRHLLPRWGKLQASAIARSDVKAMMAKVSAPSVANQVLAAASAIFSWGIKEEIVDRNPCTLVDRNPTKSRERVLSDSELPRFWKAFDSAGLVRSAALKLMLLTGQRPGEVAHMRREHVEDGWWTMPGSPILAIGWPGTKNGQSHRVWLPEAAQAAIAELGDAADSTGFVFAGPRGAALDGIDAAMRMVCAELEAERATPHDLRRTHGTMITRLGFGREAMNRVQNHKEGGIASVYDRHGYSNESKKVMEAVANRITMLVDDTAAGNVVQIGRKAKI